MPAAVQAARIKRCGAARVREHVSDPGAAECVRSAARGSISVRRRARDSNPDVLADAGFQDRCNSHSANPPELRLRDQMSPDRGHCTIPGSGHDATTGLRRAWQEIVSASVFPARARAAESTAVVVRAVRRPPPTEHAPCPSASTPSPRVRFAPHPASGLHSRARCRP